MREQARINTAGSAALIARYAVVGLTTTMIYAVIAYFAPKLFAVAPVLASICGYTLAIAFQYFAHARFTFRAKAGSAKNIQRFGLATAFGYGLSTSLVMIGQAVSAPRLLVIGLIVVLIPLCNFILLRRWVFTHPHSAPLQEEAS
ncbi:MAG: GtrA family protein [Pseudomonadota bacterium]